MPTGDFAVDADEIVRFFQAEQKKKPTEGGQEFSAKTKKKAILKSLSTMHPKRITNMSIALSRSRRTAAG